MRFQSKNVFITGASRGVLQSEPSTARIEMETNYFGLLRLTRAILPSMLEHAEGTLVVMASVTGRVPYPTQSTYSPSKAAIIAFSEALRGEVQPYGIRVLTVLPALQTPRWLKISLLMDLHLKKQSKLLGLSWDRLLQAKGRSLPVSPIECSLFSSSCFRI